MKLIERKNKKLLYSKFLYKISFDFNLAFIFRNYYQKKKLDYALKKIECFEKEIKQYSDNVISYPMGIYRQIYITENHIEDAKNLREALNNLSGYMSRHESSHQMCIFFNELDKLLPTLSNFKTMSSMKIWRPDSNILKNCEPDILISDLAVSHSHKVTVDMFRARKNKSPLLSWIRKNRNKIKISDYGIDHGFTKISMYVRDEKVLTMLKMIDLSVIVKTERLVLPG